MKGLEIKISLSNKQDQLSKCSDIAAKKKIEANISDLTTRLENIENDFINLPLTIGFERITKQHDKDYQKQNQLNDIIKQYYSHFIAANSKDAKKKIRKVIGKLLDIQIEEEAKYTYGYCTNMQEALTVIRNSFSHIGRIFIGKERGEYTHIVLNDYDTNGEKSGEVICQYMDLIELLSNPYQIEKQNKQCSIL